MQRRQANTQMKAQRPERTVPQLRTEDAPASTSGQTSPWAAVVPAADDMLPGSPRIGLSPPASPGLCSPATGPRPGFQLEAPPLFLPIPNNLMVLFKDLSPLDGIPWFADLLSVCAHL